jgi:type II secretory pathway pseudopilin PulG
MTRQSRRSHPERGSAMLVTMIVIGALIAGGAVLVSIQLQSNRSTDLTRTSTSALFCAEAGLSAARTAVAQHWATATGVADINAALAAVVGGNTTEPAWLDTLIGSHDVDGDGANDFQVYLRDNGDEGTGADAPGTDTDLQIFIVSKCTKYPDIQKEVSELVLYNGGTACNPDQQGGEDGNGNKNDGC